MKTPSASSRQYAWQRKQKAVGKCMICGKKAVNGLCARHREMNRVNSRNFYRKKHSIPLDAAMAAGWIRRARLKVNH